MANKDKKTEVDLKLNKGLPEFEKEYQLSLLNLKNNNLKIRKPEIAAEWHPTKNREFKPEDFLTTSTKRVWWLCSNGHEYQAEIQRRVRRRKPGCPVCAGRILAKDNNFKVLFPEIASEWDHNKNKLKPEEVLPRSRENIWWICSKGHSYSQRISFRTSKVSGCPYCRASNPREALWEVAFSHLENYMLDHGTSRVLQRYKTEDGFSLGSWVDNQRKNKNKLPPSKVERLHKLGFAWDTSDENWETGFENLRRFIEENGHAKVPIKYKNNDGFKLGMWVNRQKNDVLNLPQKKVSELDSLVGWNWVSREKESENIKPILIVEGEIEMRRAMSKTMKYCGYSIEISADAADGLKKFKSNEYSLVIIDIALPDGSGLKLLRDIKKITPTKPVIMATAYGTIKTAVEARKIGAFDYIHKPINFDSLRITVKKALEHEETDALESLNEIEREEEGDIVETYKIKQLINELIKRQKKQTSLLEENINILEIKIQEKEVDYEDKEERFRDLNEKYLIEVKTKENIEKRMKRMVAQYSHTLGNTLFPEILYKVSEELKNHIDFKENSLILRKAYHAEVLVKHQAEMLRAKHGSETGQEFRQYILTDRLEDNSKDDPITVKGILGYAAERVVGRLLNQNFGKLQKVRKHLEDKNKMSLDNLRNDFEERVFFNKKLTAIEWLDEKLGKIKISKLSPSWEKVLVRNDGYTHALLQGHWSELFFNALKYADYKKDVFLNLKFEEKKDDRLWLKMIWDNHSFIKKDEQSGEGLEGIEEDLRQLNEEERVDYTMNIENKKNKFKVTLNYKSDLLLMGDFDPGLIENYFS